MIFARVSLKDRINSTDFYWADTSSKDYALHQTVWGFLSKDGARRDFVFRTDRINGNPVIYIVSPTQPFVPQNSPWHADVKPYDPAIKVGEYLHFSVRVSACKKRYEESGKLKKTDIVIAKKRALRTECSPDKMPSNQQIAHMAAAEWLERQGRLYGFEVGNFQVTRHDWHKFTKRTNKEAYQISFPSLDLGGALKVLSPELFTENVLFKGMGSARSFGCGLMLVRRM
jgi:CRISPR system Cascade subunit CasE